MIVGVASSGGHLIQLEALIKMGVPIELVLSPSTPLVEAGHIRIPDCSAKTPLRAVYCAASLVRHLSRTRPDIVISTGAGPGGIALLIARLMGAKTIWIDSIANAERPSLTGRLVRPLCYLWISQWEHVANRYGGQYIGKIFSFFDSRNPAAL